MATDPAKTEAKPAPVASEAVTPAAPAVEKVEAAPAPAPIVAKVEPASPAPKAVAPKAQPKVAAPKAVKKAKPKVAVPVAKVRKIATKAAPIAASKGTKTMTDTVKQVEETVKKATADLNTRAKAAYEKATAFAKDAAEFNKANLEAFVESGKIAAKGAQTAAQNAAEYGRKNFEATSAMVKSAAAVKSPTELFKLQGDFARSQFDGAVAEMSKSSEFYLKLAGEIFQPIQTRYSVVADEMKTRLAA